VHILRVESNHTSGGPRHLPTTPRAPLVLLLQIRHVPSTPYRALPTPVTHTPRPTTVDTLGYAPGTAAAVSCSPILPNRAARANPPLRCAPPPRIPTLVRLRPRRRHQERKKKPFPTCPRKNRDGGVAEARYKPGFARCACRSVISWLGKWDVR
jgi:hypothetical protein